MFQTSFSSFQQAGYHLPPKSVAGGNKWLRSTLFATSQKIVGRIGAAGLAVAEQSRARHECEIQCPGHSQRETPRVFFFLVRVSMLEGADHCPGYHPYIWPNTQDPTTHSPRSTNVVASGCFQNSQVCLSSIYTSQARNRRQLPGDKRIMGNKQDLALLHRASPTDDQTGRTGLGPKT